LKTNRRIQGISLEGKVIDVLVNHVKVELDIDGSQDKGKAHWFPYSAEANNVWYNMPHINNRISVYFPSVYESEAMTMTAARTGEDKFSNPNVSKPTEKFFETKWGKEMSLKEDSINFNTSLMNVVLDEESISVISNDKIQIQTSDDINIGKRIVIIDDEEVIIETPNILFEAEKLLTFMVKNLSSSVELEINNKIHANKFFRVEGAIKSTLPTLTSEGQAEQEKAKADEVSAQEKAKADIIAAQELEEAKKDKKKKGLAKIGLGICKLGLAAIVITVSTVALTAAVVTSGGTLAPLAVGMVAGVMSLPYLDLIGGGISDIVEGAQDISNANKGDIDTESTNYMAEIFYDGDMEDYNEAQMNKVYVAGIDAIVTRFTLGIFKAGGFGGFGGRAPKLAIVGGGSFAGATTSTGTIIYGDALLAKTGALFAMNNSGGSSMSKPWSSTKKYGHTFSEHGAGTKNTNKLKGRAASTKENQGQWTDNQKTVDFLDSLGEIKEVKVVDIPSGLGQVIKPNGEIVQATKAIVVPFKSGIRTAYPILP
jgi:hypothetical protein